MEYEYDDGYDDGYGEYDEYGDENQEEYDEYPDFQTEMGAFDRINIQEDPWYKRLSKVPDIFQKYKLAEATLNLLKQNYKFKMYGAFVQGHLNTRQQISKLQSTGSIVLSNYVSYSKLSDSFYFSKSEFINNLNPVALCLGYYIRKSDGTVDKIRLLEIKNLLIEKKYKAVTLANIFRYLRIWNRTFKVSNPSTSVK